VFVVVWAGMPRVEPRQRNARGQGGRLRSEIVEASRRLIDDGADALTLRGIAREAGIAGPSIYDHFASVDEIRDEAVRLCFEELIARLCDADKAASDPEGRLQAICTAYVAYGEAYPYRYALLYRFVRTRDQNAATGHGGARALQILVESITDCAAVGRSSSTNPYDDAVAVWACIHGLTTLRASRPDFRQVQSDETLRDIVRRQARIIYD
jgi:AcrR family transcriptional regulator